MRQIAWIVCVVGMTIGCGPPEKEIEPDPDTLSGPDSCLTSAAVDCTEQEAQQYADDWNRQERDPQEDWRTFECGDGEIQHVSKPKNGRNIEECDWTVGRWDGEQWHGDEGPGEWQPVCIC